LVTVGKHLNNIRAIARKPPITTIQGLLEAVFSFGPASRLYSEDLRLAEAVQLSEVKFLADE
jgi:hypothetical protein